jgi:hypothetical protein
MTITKIYANKDASINSTLPTTNFGSENIVQCYYYPPPPVSYIIHGLIGFDISALPKNILSVTLNLYRIAGGTDTIYFFTLLRDFTESEVTWNNASTNSQWTDPGGDYGNFPFVSNSDGSTGWIKVDVPISLLTGNQLNFLFRTSENESVARLGRYTSKDDNSDINKPFQPYLEIQYDTEVTVTDVSVTPMPVQKDQSVTITTKVYNSTIFARQVNIITKIDNTTEIDRFPVTINGNETYSRQVLYSFSTTGLHTICSQADTSIQKCISIDVKDQPSISITSVTTNPLNTFPDTPFDIIVTLKNNSATDGTIQLMVSIDGTILSNTTESVTANNTISKRISTTVSSGNHHICANTYCIDITTGYAQTDYSKYYVPVSIGLTSAIILYYAYLNYTKQK